MKYRQVLAFILAGTIAPVLAPNLSFVGITNSGRAIAQELADRSGVLLQEAGELGAGSQVMESDRSLYNEHHFEGQQGQRVSIRMESRDFDSYLILLDPQGNVLEEADDVCGDPNTLRCINAEIEIELPTSGTYTVYANAYSYTGRGRYTLTVRED